MLGISLRKSLFVVTSNTLELVQVINDLVVVPTTYLLPILSPYLTPPDEPCDTRWFMTQRRLSGMERDLAAIQAKLDALQAEAEAIEDEHPDEAAVIRERITQITQIWEQLTQMVSNPFVLQSIRMDVKVNSK